MKDTAAFKKVREEKGGWDVGSKWAYENAYSECFYDLEARSTELLDEHVIPALEKSGKPVGLFVSHDMLVVTLVVYASMKNVDLKYYQSSSRKWLNYLAGIAIVIKPDGTRIFYAVNGLESATMTM